MSEVIHGQQIIQGHKVTTKVKHGRAWAIIDGTEPISFEKCQVAGGEDLWKQDIVFKCGCCENGWKVKDLSDYENPVCFDCLKTYDLDDFRSI